MQIGLVEECPPNCLVVDCKYGIGIVLAIDSIIQIVHQFGGGML